MQNEINSPQIKGGHMTHLQQKKAKGQAVEAIALLLALGVLIGLVALAFDGGSALLQRRTQENGAQAGALAGVDIMAHNVLTNCHPGPCHPAYVLTNNEVYAQVLALASANRGGTTGAQPGDYTVSIDYHYNADSPNYPNGFHAAARDDNIVPEFVDGLRVTTSVNNPTTFARALPNPITDLKVSGQAAALIYPTCSPEGGAGSTLPFTRMRPLLEYEIAQSGNSTNTPYELWTSHGDLGGNWKNVISLNVTTFNPHGVITSQLLTAFDPRNGPENPIPPNGWPNSGLRNFDKNAGAGNLTPCTAGPDCADMRGSGSSQNNAAAQDDGNWVFWAWRGVISTTHLYLDTSTIKYNTNYPSTAATQGGTCCGAQANRPGDWAEIGYNGDLGRNRKEAILAEIDSFGTTGPLSGAPLNWGLAITRTVYVWGEPEAQLPSSKSTQHYDPSAYTTQEQCSPPRQGCTITVDHPAWVDVTLSGSNGSYNANNVDRVRFTKAYTFIFYRVPVSGGNTSSVSAFLIYPAVPGPVGGDCPAGWQTGSGVYYRQIDPNP
jgi:hypothetical protein